MTRLCSIFKLQSTAFKCHGKFAKSTKLPTELHGKPYDVDVVASPSFDRDGHRAETISICDLAMICKDMPNVPIASIFAEAGKSCRLCKQCAEHHFPKCNTGVMVGATVCVVCLGFANHQSAICADCSAASTSRNLPSMQDEQGVSVLITRFTSVLSERLAPFGCSATSTLEQTAGRFDVCVTVRRQAAVMAVIIVEVDPSEHKQYSILKERERTGSKMAEAGKMFAELDHDAISFIRFSNSGIFHRLPGTDPETVETDKRWVIMFDWVLFRAITTIKLQDERRQPAQMSGREGGMMEYRMGHASAPVLIYLFYSWNNARIVDSGKTDRNVPYTVVFAFGSICDTSGMPIPAFTHCPHIHFCKGLTPWQTEFKRVHKSWDAWNEYSVEVSKSRAQHFEAGVVRKIQPYNQSASTVGME
jgi:hypothetical protein